MAEKIYRTYYDDKGQPIKKEVFEEGREMSRDAISSAINTGRMGGSISNATPSAKRSNLEELRKKFGGAVKSAKKNIDNFNEYRNRAPASEEIHRERQRTQLMREKYRQEVIKSKLRKSQGQHSPLSGFASGDVFLGSGGMGRGSFFGDSFAGPAPLKSRKRRTIRSEDDYDYSGGVQWFS